MSATKPDLLYFDRVDFNLAAWALSPHFHCPYCGELDHSKRTWSNLSTSLGTSIPANFDLPSKQVAFTVPMHSDLADSKPCLGSGKKITLYIAAHRVNSGAVAFCISIEPIAVNWWRKE